MHTKKAIKDTSLYCRSKRLQCYHYVQNFFDQSIKNNIKTYENIKEIATGQGDDDWTGFLLDYPYLKENYRVEHIRFK